MPPDGSGGLFLLLTESFAVRAMLGSLAAVGLVYIAVRTMPVHTSRARRLLILAPITAAGVTGLLSLGEAFLPRLWVASTAGGSAGQFLEFLGESWFLSPQRELDLLVIAWAAVATVLLARRLTGTLVVRAMLTRARPVPLSDPLARTTQRLARDMSVRSPRVLLLRRCPGGALTARTIRPVVVVDPEVLASLDEREAEGLLAHELAHIRRRDNLVAGAIGIFRDLAFFLPPVHLTARWLRMEREESADELACAHTHRPGALASGILKVWDACRMPRRALGCTAVPARSLALAGGGTITALEAIERRVERLVRHRGPLSRLRGRAEVGFAGTVTAVAVTAAIAVPAWLVNRYDAAGIAVGYLAAPPVADVESPAFATFRTLAPEKTAATGAAEVSSASRNATVCPCVETRTQWLDRTPATATPTHSRAMAWGSADREAWELESLRRQRASRDARPLLTVSDPAQHVGFFVLGAVPQSQ